MSPWSRFEIVVSRNSLKRTNGGISFTTTASNPAKLLSPNKIPTRWEFYEDGLLVSVEEDVDRDGRPDKWETREAGLVTTASFDEDGDGRPERRLVYDAGVLVAIESQPDATGGYLTRVDVAR